MRKKLETIGDLTHLPRAEMSHEEAAKYLGVTPQTLHNWNSKERGPRSVRRFGRRRYQISDLDAFLKHEQEVKEAYR